MSYLVLARKSRPQTFDQVVGQRPIVKTLKNSIVRGRIAHAILFSGVRGVGKTTLARLMAKAINCQAPTESRPCDQCPSCKEITAGNFLDLLEIDGASNRGIQEIRELKEKIRFLPASAPFKIIIIDEVHMLTTEAFNALLKTLEEPPKHVYFMFATTEIHKVPITILSRCQRYELKRVSASELADHFQKLAVAEGFSLEAEALALIVRESGGSVRDGLSLLEQMFSYGEKEIRATEVTEVLGLVSRQLLLQITTALLENDRTAALTCLEDIFDYGMDLRRFIEDLLNHFRTLLFCRIKGCSELVDATAEELAEFKKIAAEHSGETIHLKLSLLMELAERLRFSSQPRLLLETSFVKIIEAGNVVSITTLLGKLDKLLPDEPLAAEQNDQDRAKDPLPPPAAPATMRPQPEKDNNQDQPAQPSPSSLVKKTGPNQHPAAEPSSAQPSSRPEVVEDGQGQPGSKKTEPQATQPQNPLNEPSVQIKSHKKNIRSHWLEFIDYVKARKPWMSTDLQRADRAGEKVEGELHLHFADPANCALMRRKENRQLLTEFALDFFQKPLKIVFVLPEATESPENDEDDLPQKKRQQLANDPLVLMATEIFNGQVGDIRIGPQQN